MNVGGSNSFDRIKYARPLKGEPGLPVDAAKAQSSRPSLELISRDNHSEFSPIQVLRRLEEKGDLDKTLLESYRGASSNREVALKLKREFFDPVVDYARNSGRDVEAVKQELKNAILSHIDLTQVRLRQEPSASPVRTENYALAA
jgi:hypothetical protein